MKERILGLFRLTWLELLVAVAITIVLTNIFVWKILPKSSRIDPLIYLMAKVCAKIEMGYSRDEILTQMNRGEKRLVEKYKVGWDDEVFPVETERGKLKRMFYPPDHVVVYAEPIPYGKNKDRVVRFYTGRGEIHGCREVSDLKSFREITRFGSFEILLGTIADINDIPTHINVDKYPQVYGYLLLKNLMLENKDFLKYAVSLALRKEQWTNKWLAHILKSAIISPPLPELDLDLGKEESFYDTLSKWHQKNADKIEFTNDFLFEKH